VPGDSTLVVRVKGIDIGIAICEDIWHSLADLASRKPGVVLVPNGSPYERNKDDVRLALVQKRAQEVGAPLAYVNMTGGQDDLVFDGDTIVVDAKGTVISRAAQFEEQVLVVDIQAATETSKPDVVISENGAESAGSVAPAIAARMSDHQEIWNALVMGLRDYVAKNKFRSVVVGLSGGIDSALVAAIAVDALGAQCVNGVAMPSKYSSDHSVEDATAFAANTGIHFRTVSIEPMVESFMQSITLKGLAAENIQARVRGTTLMGVFQIKKDILFWPLEINQSSQLGTQLCMETPSVALRQLRTFTKQMSGRLPDGETNKLFLKARLHRFLFALLKKSRALNYVLIKRTQIHCQSTKY
jgi:NAD+ synthase (glutamine-hydrolysing)